MIGSWQAILGSGAAWVREARQKTRATSLNILRLCLVSYNRCPVKPLFIYTLTQLLDDKGMFKVHDYTLYNIVKCTVNPEKNFSMLDFFLLHFLENHNN